MEPSLSLLNPHFLKQKIVFCATLLPVLLAKVERGLPKQANNVRQKTLPPRRSRADIPRPFCIYHPPAHEFQGLECLGRARLHAHHVGFDTALKAHPHCRGF